MDVAIHRLHDALHGSLHCGLHTHTIWVWNTLHDSFHEYHHVVCMSHAPGSSHGTLHHPAYPTRSLLLPRRGMIGRVHPMRREHPLPQCKDIHANMDIGVSRLSGSGGIVSVEGCLWRSLVRKGDGSDVSWTRRTQGEGNRSRKAAVVRCEDEGRRQGLHRAVQPQGRGEHHQVGNPLEAQGDDLRGRAEPMEVRVGRRPP